MEKDHSLDILGIKPIGTAVENVTSKSLDGASAFLSRVCLPAAEEFGLLMQDHVKSWRASRAAKLALKAEEKVNSYHGTADVKVHPRIAHTIFEEGSWVEDEIIHDMWAGLLASSCENTGLDDSNIIFIGILKQLTVLQVRVLQFSVENATKFLSVSGWPCAEEVTCSLQHLKTICQTEDIFRIDRELDHLRSLELIGDGMNGGFYTNSEDANITPTGLALHLYVRGEGFHGTPIEYWNLQKMQ